MRVGGGLPFPTVSGSGCGRACRACVVHATWCPPGTRATPSPTLSTLRRRARLGGEGSDIRFCEQYLKHQLQLDLGQLTLPVP